MAAAKGCYREVKLHINTAHQLLISPLYPVTVCSIRTSTHKAKPHNIATQCKTPGTALSTVVGQEL